MIFETEACAGCRSCQIACSYHHKGVFSPSISSIKIINRPKEQAFAIEIYKEVGNGRLACDGCAGLEEPLCLKYCSPLMHDELKDILRRFLEGAK